MATVENSKYGDLALCPVVLFKLALSRAKKKDRESLSPLKYKKYLDSLHVLVGKAGLPNKIEGRNRHCYTAHSSRIGGVCMLLGAGLSETIISNICDWTGDSIRRYSEMVSLEPSRVQPYAFYNPVALKKAYNN